MTHWLHPRESGPDVDRGPNGVIASPNLLDRSWCGVSRTIWRFCWQWSIL